MTSADLITRVMNRLAPDADSETRNALSFPIAQATRDGLIEIAHECARSSNHAIAQLTQKTFTVTVTSGVADLSTAIAASEPLLAGDIDKAEIYHTSSLSPLQWVPDTASLKRDMRALYIYYTSNGSSLLTRNVDGSLTSLTGSLTINGPAVLLLSSIPTQLEERVVEIVTGLVKVDGQVEPQSNESAG